MNQRVHLVASGRVQGVFYRASARARAGELGLTGWIRNREDGAVEAVAEGPRELLEDFVAYCGKGPPAAKVTELKTTWAAATGEFSSFAVER